MLDGDGHLYSLAAYRRTRDKHRARIRGAKRRKGGRLRFRLFDDYTPHRRQVELHKCGARFAVVVAGRRGGKTYAGGREFMRRIFNEDLRAAVERVRQGERKPWERPELLGKRVKPFLHYWCVAPTYDLGAYQQQEIFEILGGESSPLVLKWNENDHTLWLRGGIKIEFKSAEREKRLVGSGLSGMWIDEAARVKEQAWTDNLQPTLADRQGWALLTTTPLGKNWLYREFWERTQYGPSEKQDKAFYGVHFRTVDNTHIPALVEEARRAKKVLPLAEYLRNYEASFEAFKGKIYGSFVDGDTHLFGSGNRRARPNTALVRDKYDRIVAGVDWGYRNPGAIVVVAFTHDGAAEVLHEEYASEVTVAPTAGRKRADSWVKRMRRLVEDYAVERFYADPSDADNIAQCRAAGLAILPARNAVIPGISVTAAMLEPREDRAGRSRPNLRIARRCENLRRELLTYQWQDETEAPVKKDDHTCDALRYALYTEHMLSPNGLEPLRGLEIYKHAA